MAEILDQRRVLKLNKEWQAIDACTVRHAIKSITKHRGFIFVCSSCSKEFSKEEYLKIAECDNCGGQLSRNEDIPFVALHIDFPQLPTGGIDFQSPVTILPVHWKDWIDLPIRPQDKYLRTSNNAVRVPTVIVTENYTEIPKKTPQYSNHGVFKRDGGIDQYTGLFVPKNEGNVDHYIPRDLGGKTDYENCVWTSRKINEMKANMHPDEFFKKHGYKLLRKPKRPGPKLQIYNKYNIPEWNVFLKGQGD